MSKEKVVKCRKEKCRMQLTPKIKCQKGVGDGGSVRVGVGVGEDVAGWVWA